MTTPIDPELAAAFGIASNPGVYALLLGSGVSRSAGIPTGWEIVLDLIRRVAVAEGEDAGPNPAAWYASRFGEAPRYSSLIGRLAPSAADRQALLRGYFEGDDDNPKAPTVAHRAIAQLVAGGLVRVIVTTNFDKLMERALEEEGIAPVVISTGDQATGAPPLAHSSCTVIKAHGDYLDARIKNSDGELSTFDDRINERLDQAFDEYGLIVCGWSGEFDVALRCAIERSKSRRYTTYWCHRGRPVEEARQLITHRGAQQIEIADADSFFSDLGEKVVSICEVGSPHPLDVRAAVETLKRYLLIEEHYIRVRELVRDASEQVAAQLSGDACPDEGSENKEEHLILIRRIEALAERSIALIANGCYWGESRHDVAWVELVRRFADLALLRTGNTRYTKLVQYPALLSLYAAGISAVSTSNFELLQKVLLAPCRWGNYSGPKVVVGSIVPGEIIRGDGAGLLAGEFKVSEYLQLLLRPVFSDLIAADHEYTDAFDRFEYLANIVCQDAIRYEFVYGAYCQRNRYSEYWVPKLISQEINEQKEQWQPLRSGLFGGSLERLLAAKKTVDESIARRYW